MYLPFTKFRLHACILVLVLGVIGAFAEIPPGHAANEDPVASVNGDPILPAEVRTALEFVPQQYQTAPPDRLVPQLIDQLIELRVLSAAAVDNGFDKDVRVRYRLDFYRAQLLRQAFIEDLIANHITDEMLRQAYDDMVADNSGNDEIRARHILVVTEEEALSVVAALDEGADFGALAAERSTGPSGSSGGDLGYFGAGQMVPAFSEAAFALEVGEVSAPVQTQFGWHVIKLEDRRATPPPSFDEAVEDLRAQASEDVTAKAIEAALADAAIERFEIDPVQVLQAPVE